MSLADLLSFLPPVRDYRLRMAVYENDLPAVQRLLRRGADPNILVNGCSFLVQAIHCADHRVIRALIAAGANLQCDGAFALSAAATAGHARTVEVLLQAGVDPNAALPHGFTALQSAMIT